jgi:hypothetical protein
MPLYVHEVDAQVVPEAAAGAGAPTSLTPEELQRIVSAVLQELDRRQQQARSFKSEAAITGQNRPPSLGT